jgi:hypothetical protein
VPPYFTFFLFVTPPLPLVVEQSDTILTQLYGKETIFVPKTISFVPNEIFQ